MPKHRAEDDFSKNVPYWLMDENVSEFSTNDYILSFKKKKIMIVSYKKRPLLRKLLKHYSTSPALCG